jgi:hypothetical protein
MKITKIILSVILILLVCNLLVTKLTTNNQETVQTSNNKNAPFYIIVDLDDNKLYLYKDGTLHKTYSVSSGKPSTPSPLGTWKIMSKANWGEGFGGTWMGFNVPWGKYGIHGTDEPWSIGKDLSKGCIRMFNNDAKELRKIVPVGTKVTIIKGPYGAFGAGLRTIKPGDVGSDVYAVQSKLKELGYYNNWVDGKYGAGMHSAINKFQKDKKLVQTKYIQREFYKALGIELFE